MQPASRLFLLPDAVERDPAVEEWFASRGELGEIARRWFEVMRACGPDVRELLHDGHPTACVGQAAFAYVNAFTAHVNVGFFNGAELDDPAGLLKGSGKFMRHVKLMTRDEIDHEAARVDVKILTDVEGSVIEAEIIRGPAELHAAALDAARKLKFPPTLLSGVPTKVSGWVSLDFKP